MQLFSNLRLQVAQSHKMCDKLCYNQLFSNEWILIDICDFLCIKFEVPLM